MPKQKVHKLDVKYIKTITQRGRLRLRKNEIRGQDLAGRRSLYKMTLVQVGKIMGLSSERVRQIEREALRKLAYRLGPIYHELIETGAIQGGRA